MAIQATFTADFTKWDAALKNAQANLKTFEVSTKGITQSLQRMASSLDGTKIMREAKTAAAAVEAIGGASKLTAAEQRKVNATVTEAIAKYKALGQTAPKELVKLQKETAGVNTAMAGIGSTLLKIGGLFAATFTIGALTRAAKSVIELGGQLTDLSARTGLSTKALQEFRFAGGQVGVSMEAITSAVGQMQKRIAGGGDSVVGAFTALGLSVKALRNLSPEDQFAAIAEKIKAIEDPAARAKLAMDVMGKGALEVMPLLVSNFDELRKKANDLGVVLDDKTIAALDEMGDTLDALSLVGQAILANVLVPMAPHLKDLGTFALELAGHVKTLGAELTHAQLLFQDFLIAISDAAVKMYELQGAVLQLAKITNPLANIFGQLDKQIAEAATQAAYYRDLSKGLTADLQRQIADGLKPHAAAVTASTKAIAPFNVATEEQRRAAEAAAKALAELRKEITGAKTLTSIKQMAQAWTGLTKSQKESAPALSALAKFYDALGPNLAELPPELRAIVKEGEDASRAVGALSEEYKSVREEVTKLDTILDRLELAADAEEARQVLQDIGAELGLVGRRIEEAFDLSDQLDATIADIRGVDNAIQEMFEAVDTQDESFGAKLGGNLKKNLLDSVAGIPEIITQGILHDASWEEMAIAIATTIGAAIGSAIGFALAGPAGAQIGAALGSLLGPLLDAVWETRAEETQQRIREEFGVSISEGLAQAIEDAAADFAGNREAAKLFNLDRIIAEGGGLTVDNIDEMFARLHDVYSQMETGAFNAADAQKVLNENFKTFADFVTHDGALASRELLEIIRLNNEMGTQSAAVAEFVTAQVTSALGGLTQFLENAEVTSQAAAQGIAASVFGAFEALTQQGATPLEAIKQITPVLEQLDAQLKAAGFSGGAAFDQLRAMAALANDEIRGPMIEAISGLGVALEGLHNSGVLNQEMFAGLATQITDTYNKLIAQGTDGAQALQLTGESLQTLWELQQDFGYAVDDATQKLLDEAKAAGVVGDEHRSVQERMLLAMDRTADAVEALAHLFGAELPSEIAKTADAIEKIPTDVDIKVGYNVEDLPPNAVPIDGSGAAGGRPTDTILLGADEAAQIPQRILDAMDAATPEMQAQIDLWLAEFDRFEQESGEHADAIPTKYLDAMEDATPEMQEQYKNWLAIAEGAVNDTGDIFAGLPDDINRGCWTPILREGDVVFAGIEDAAYDASHGVVDQFTEASRRTREALDKIPDDLHIKVNYDVERLPDAGFGTGGSGSRTRDELRAGAIHLANGGPVYAAQGMFVPRGTDTVPAMLTPGEVVLPREVVSALRSSATTPAVTVHLTIQTLDGADVDRVVRSPEFRKALTSAVSGNVGGYRSDLRSAMGVR